MASETKYPVEKTDEEWRRILTPAQYAVLRGHGTESPGSCALLREHRAGTFCIRASDDRSVDVKESFVVKEFMNSKRQ